MARLDASVKAKAKLAKITKTGTGHASMMVKMIWYAFAAAVLMIWLQDRVLGPMLARPRPIQAMLRFSVIKDNDGGFGFTILKVVSGILAARRSGFGVVAVEFPEVVKFDEYFTTVQEKEKRGPLRTMEKNDLNAQGLHPASFYFDMKAATDAMRRDHGIEVYTSAEASNMVCNSWRRSHSISWDGVSVAGWAEFIRMRIREAVTSTTAASNSCVPGVDLGDALVPVFTGLAGKTAQEGERVRNAVLTSLLGNLAPPLKDIARRIEDAATAQDFMLGHIYMRGSAHNWIDACNGVIEASIADDRSAIDSIEEDSILGELCGTAATSDVKGAVVKRTLANVADQLPRVHAIFGGPASHEIDDVREVWGTTRAGRLGEFTLPTTTSGQLAILDVYLCSVARFAVGNTFSSSSYLCKSLRRKAGKGMHFYNLRYYPNILARCESPKCRCTPSEEMYTYGCADSDASARLNFDAVTESGACAGKLLPSTMTGAGDNSAIGIRILPCAD